MCEITSNRVIRKTERSKFRTNAPLTDKYIVDRRFSYILKCLLMLKVAQSNYSNTTQNNISKI